VRQIGWRRGASLGILLCHTLKATHTIFGINILCAASAGHLRGEIHYTLLGKGKAIGITKVLKERMS
jgi:hypothetical protein